MKKFAAVLAVGIAVSSSFAMAEVDRNSTMQHDYAAVEGRQALKVLLESGDESPRVSWRPQLLRR